MKKTKGERDPQDSAHPLRKIVALPFSFFHHLCLSDYDLSALRVADYEWSPILQSLSSKTCDRDHKLGRIKRLLYSL